MLLRRRRTRGRRGGAKRRPEALLLLLLVPSSSWRSASKATTSSTSTSTLRRRRPTRVVDAHPGRATHGRPPVVEAPSRARGPRRRVGLRREPAAGARDWPRGDGLCEQELGVVVADVGAVLEARVVLVADDRLR